MSRKELINAARNAMKKAYNPYSNIKIGAALMTSDGSIFSGCNIENASYSMTICAERVALFKAVSEGHKKFSAIAISSSKKKIFPCGACRQVLLEFDKNIKVYIDDDPKIYTLNMLIPHSFTKKSLRK